MALASANTSDMVASEVREKVSRNVNIFLVGQHA